MTIAEVKRKLRDLRRLELRPRGRDTDSGSRDDLIRNRYFATREGAKVRRAITRLTLIVAASLAGLTASLAADEVTTPITAVDITDLGLMDQTVTSFARFYEHVTSKHPGLDQYYARRLYGSYESACAEEGVSLVVALAQMIHETDYLRFTGSVRAVQYNYAGLGSTSVGIAGLAFPDLDTGVRAHVQHLKAYGSTEPLRTPLVDPRFHFVRRGSAATVIQLTGRWATDPDYGGKVLAHARALLL